MASIQGIYVALFGRPADPAGLQYFNTATNNGANLNAIGDLAATAEYQDRFKGMDNAGIVTAIYQSLFGRNPELAGLTFFVDALNKGTININNVAINILDGAKGDDLATVNNKITAADAFTKAIDTPDELAAYRGDAAADAGRAFLAPITADKATIPSEAATDAAVAGLGSAPGSNIFVLTDAVGEQVLGTTGNDTFKAVLDTGAATDSTLNIGDTINGKDGIDRLDLVLTGGGTTLPGGVSISNVEIVNLISTGGAVLAAVDSDNFAGVKELWQVNAVSAAPVSVGADVTAGFRDVTGGATLAVEAKDGVSSLHVAIESVDDASTVAYTEKTGDDVTSVTIDGSVKTVGGSNTLIIDGSATTATTDLHVGLTSNTEVSFVANTLTHLANLDMSASTGNLSFSAPIANSDFADSAVSAVTIKLGSGNDKISFDADNAAVGGGEHSTSITLGAGHDSLTITGGGNLIATTINAAALDRDLIKVTDFAKAEDVLNINAIAGGALDVQNDVNGAVAGKTTLLDAVKAVAALNAGADHTAIFEFDGNTYVYNDTGTHGSVDTGDTLIELVGVKVADLVQGTNFVS